MEWRRITPQDATARSAREPEAFVFWPTYAIASGLVTDRVVLWHPEPQMQLRRVQGSRQAQIRDRLSPDDLHQMFGRGSSSVAQLALGLKQALMNYVNRFNLSLALLNVQNAQLRRLIDSIASVGR